MKIAVVSDTHGLLREEVIENLSGCNYIIHAGDIGSKDIIDKLNSISKTIIVRGNNDNCEFANEIELTEKITIEGLNIFVIHEIKNLPRNLENIDIVIYGHSHKYSLENKNNITFLNPGSCGKKRFSLPLTMAILSIDNGNIEVEKIDIK